MSALREKFGAFVRRERENKEIGLREMAKMIGVSPTYLSKVEREDRVASDLSDIIKRHPVELAALLRTTKGLTSEDIAGLARNAHKVKGQ